MHQLQNQIDNNNGPHSPISPGTPRSGGSERQFMSVSPSSSSNFSNAFCGSPSTPKKTTKIVFSVMDPTNFHLHFIPFENYHGDSIKIPSKPSSGSANGVLTISEILRKIPCPLPKEYLYEIQNRTKSIANLFDHIKQIARDMSLKQEDEPQQQTQQVLQNKMMDYMNRKFREWLTQSGYDREYKVFLPNSQQQRNVARKRSSSGNNKIDLGINNGE